MSSPGQVSEATQQAAGQTAGAAKQEAANVGHTAAAAASDVASTTKEQAGTVANEAVSQVRGLADQAKAQVTEQANNATSKLSSSVRELAQELRQMSRSGDRQGPAAEVIGSVADRGEQLADYLEHQSPGGLVQELRSFAARRPGGFIAGALLAGVAAGRVTRGAKDATSGPDASSRPSGTASGYGTTYGTTPAYGTTYQTAPVNTSPAVAPVPPIDIPPVAPMPPVGTVGTVGSVGAGPVDYGQPGELDAPYPSASSSSTYGGMPDTDPLATPAYERDQGLR